MFYGVFIVFKNGMSNNPNPHIVFVVNVDWFFVSHRLALATFLQQQGWKVSLITQVTDHATSIQAQGIDVYPLPPSRGRTNLFRELYLCYFLWKMYRRLKPSLIHQVGLKLITYGTVANRLGKHIPSIQAVSGLGTYWYQSVVLPYFYRLNRPWLAHPLHQWVFQNEMDAHILQECLQLNTAQIHLIKGVGVDTQYFSPRAQNPTQTLRKVVLVARMIEDKGIFDFIQAAHLLRSRWQGKVQFELVGGIDADNPRAIAKHTLQEACVPDYIVWKDFQHDIRQNLAEACLVVLPSYHEGFPKILLEASAMEKAIVASDCAGCRSLIKDNENGLLFPVGQVEALAQQIDYLLRNPFLRKILGQKARKIVEQQFTHQHISTQFWYLYQHVLHNL